MQGHLGAFLVDLDPAFSGLPTSRHEILMETDDIRARFWAAFDAYLADAAAAA